MGKGCQTEKKSAKIVKKPQKHRKHAKKKPHPKGAQAFKRQLKRNV